MLNNNLFGADTEVAGKSNPGEAVPDQQQQQQHETVTTVSVTPSTPTPPDDQAAAQNDDYDTEATESELALSEPAASPSPPVHDEFSQHRATEDQT